VQHGGRAGIDWKLHKLGQSLVTSHSLSDWFRGESNSRYSTAWRARVWGCPRGLKCARVWPASWMWRLRQAKRGICRARAGCRTLTARDLTPTTCHWRY